MNIDVQEIDGRVKTDKELALTVRLWTGRVLLEIGSSNFTLVVLGGFVSAFVRGAVGEPSIRLSATEDVWARQFAAVPEAFYQDAMMGTAHILHELTISGDTQRDIFPYYSVVQRLIAIIRETCNPGFESPTAPSRVDRNFDSAVGRYVYVVVDEVQYRVYFEESGQGIPLVCQHTAGSDGRQYRHQLEDVDLQAKYRIIAYDLPFHGKSLPPTGKAWWTEEYKLTQDFLFKFIAAFCAILELDRPIFMGCSLGGVLAPDLARYLPDKFRAVIGINSHVYIGSDPGLGYLDPRVGSNWKASSMMGIMAPGAPEAYRREIGWCYSQGAPSVLFGDLNYYNLEHDLRGELDKIDTKMIPIYIVVGEYDPSVTGANGSGAVARGITGAHYEMVPQGGHFLMVENPGAFKPVLAGILDQIDRSQATIKPMST